MPWVSTIDGEGGARGHRQNVTERNAKTDSLLVNYSNDKHILEAFFKLCDKD